MKTALQSESAAPARAVLPAGMLPICGGQDLPMIEVKSIFENVHFVDYGGRSDSGRYKFIKTLIICHNVKLRVELISGCGG